MNILQIQDKLKDLSDQQLVSEMTNPSGSAPQFLVLSEMKRRKEMRARASTPQAPQGSMADEAVQDGIAALAQQPSSYDLDDQAEAEEMAAGGIVRLSAGGDISAMSADQLRQLLGQMSDPRFRPPGITASTDEIRQRLADLEQRQEDAFLQAPRSRLRQDAGRIGEAIHGAVGATGSALSSAGRSIADTGRAAARYALDPVASPSPFPNNRFEEPEAARLDPLVEPIPERDPVRAADPFVAAPTFLDGPNTGSPSVSPVPSVRPSSSRPTGTEGRVTGTAGASGTAATSVAPAAASASGIGSLPQARGFSAILDDIERRGSGSRLDELAAQMQRTDPAARRADATNLALLEAGLRIAGSNNPNAIGALSEGAAALPGYARQLSEIRKDQRDDILTQIQMERARAEDNRSARALAANLYGTETQRELAVMRERGDAGRHAATMGYNERRLAADQEHRTQSLVPQDIRTFRSMVGADYDDNNPRHREVMSQIQTRGAVDRVPESVRLAEWINSAPTEDERRRRLEATGRDPALRQAQQDETRRRNIEDATRRFREANPGFVPNLTEENIGRMRPDAQQRYRALQAEFNRIQRGELATTPTAPGAPPPGATIHRLVP